MNGYKEDSQRGNMGRYSEKINTEEHSKALEFSVSFNQLMDKVSLMDIGLGTNL